MMLDLDRLEELHDDAADEVGDCVYWGELSDENRSHMIEFARLVIMHRKEIEK